MEKLRAGFQGADVRDFSLLKTERQRIEHLFNIDKLYDDIEIISKYGLKSNDTSVKYREQGNIEFKRKLYHKSLESYTNSVFSATTDSQDSYLALALANRSAALFHINHYQDCIKDIELGLNNGYPKEMYYKLYERRGQCFWQLGKQDLAQQDWKLAMENAKAHPGKSADNIIKKLEKSLSKNIENGSHNVKDISIQDDETDVKEFTSKCYSVQSNASKGRHVIAAGNLNVGEDIIREEPYAAVLFDTCRLYRCWHCFSLCYCLLPCDSCNHAGFCSNSCFESSKFYHQGEELYFQSVGASGLDRLGHLALRIVFLAGFAQMNFFNTSVNGAITASSDQKFQQIMEMSSNSEKRGLKNWFDMSLMTIYLLKYLTYTNFFPEVPTAETQIKVGTVILNILEILQCNGITLSEIEIKSEFSECKPRDMGLGVYIKASRFNHSCDPSAEFNFMGKYCIVKAVRNIKKGREINTDYGPVYYLQPREFRKEALVANYMFECKCKACIYDWPLFENLQANQPVFKCSSCGKKMRNANLNKFKCKKCGKVENLPEIVNKLMTSFERYSQVMHTVTPDNFQQVLPFLKQHLNLMSTHVCLPWKDYASCQATLKQCFRLMGNRHVASN